MNKNNEAFKNILTKVVTDQEMRQNPKLLRLLREAISKTERNQSVRSIAASLSLEIKKHFNEAELPKAIIDLQLDIQKFAAVGGTGIIPHLNRFSKKTKN